MSTGNPKKATAEDGNRIKDPEDWVTGDEEMTAAQASYLKTLTEEAHEEFHPELTKAEASQEIDALKQKTGRGRKPAGRKNAGAKGSPENSAAGESGSRQRVGKSAAKAGGA